MTETTIFVDESGFTGTALNDAEQPFFCVASHIIPEDVAEGILKESFPTYQGNEFKAKQIFKTGKHKARLPHFSEALAAHTDKIFIWTVDKRFCLLTKMVDFLVEPIVTATGTNFYTPGFPPKFCNMFYTALTLFEGQALYDAVTEAYANLSVNPSQANLDGLIQTLDTMVNSVGKEAGQFLKMALLGALNFEEFHDFDSFGDTNEVQLTSVLSSVLYWSDQVSGDLRLIHDQSNNFFDQKDLWGALTNINLPVKIVKKGWGGEASFPLRVLETIDGKSEDHYGIQLSDILAGMSTRAKKGQLEGSIEPMLVKALEGPFGQIDTNGIRPEPDFPDVWPGGLDGPDVVDDMTGFLQSAGHKFGAGKKGK